MTTVERALGGPANEVVAKARRRRFTLEYKRKIVREVDACKAPGAVGALLRREGLYSSHLATWRAARERGELAGAAKKRGPAPVVTDARDKVIAELGARAHTVEAPGRAGRGAGRSPKKTRGAAGDAARAARSPDGDGGRSQPSARHRADMRGLGLPRSTYYRRRQPRPTPQPRPSPRALSAGEQAAVLAVLHEARFVDLAPAEVYATLLDDGQYLCSERTMYRVLAAHGEVQGAARSAPPSRLCRPRAAGPPPQRAVELGHHQALGPGEVDLLLPVRDARCLQPVRGRLDGGASRERDAGRAVHRETCGRQGIAP